MLLAARRGAQGLRLVTADRRYGPSHITYTERRNLSFSMLARSLPGSPTRNSDLSRNKCVVTALLSAVLGGYPCPQFVVG